MQLKQNLMKMVMKIEKIPITAQTLKTVQPVLKVST